MKLIVGLGNPGRKYEKTRHNVGFLFVDAFREDRGFDDWKDSKFEGVVSEGKIGTEKVILLKPLTFMNLSGRSVQKALSYYKLSADDLVVVYDDVDMEFAKVRFRDTGRSGGHNGIKSIIENIGTDSFRRVKIGIGRHDKMETSDWVLSKLKRGERKNLTEEVFPDISQKLA